MRIHKISKTIQDKKKYVAAYCRVSTGKESQEDSLETQIKVYRNIIETNPQWEFAGIYSDSGRTGTDAAKRPGFQRMIADAMDGKVDIILVKSISRFARNVVDSQRYVQRLKECGIIVKFERENISTDDPASEFVFSLLSAIAQDESHSMSENVKWAYQNRFAQGRYCLGNHRILGYDTDRNGKLVPNQDAWIVREVFRRFLAGETYRQIADGITGMGARCLRTNRPFSPETIRSMVGNETYVGDKLLQKKPPIDYLTKKPDINSDYKSFYLEDDHVGIIDRETWQGAQKILIRRREELAAGIQRKGKQCHFLYGKLFCGECGAPFVRRTLRGSSQKQIRKQTKKGRREQKKHQKRNQEGEQIELAAPMTVPMSVSMTVPMSNLPSNSTLNPISNPSSITTSIYTYKAWSCRERLKGTKGNGCKNSIIREGRLLEQISEEMGWTGKDVSHFDSERFDREIQSIKIKADQIIIIRQKR